MRQYNKQQVMKDAHRLYGSEFHRKGRSWSECLGVGNMMLLELVKKKQQSLML